MTLDGPFSVMIRGADGELTDKPAPGVHYKTTADAASDALAPYTVTPALLQSVWAGDDPAAPEITLSLRFPDDATAQAVIAACDETPPSPPAE